MDRIFLIGMMGVGKTTIGRDLAKKLNYTFYDTDDVIVNKFNIHNDDILGFFEDRKEYLNEETIVIKDLIGQKDVVVATGGGIVLKDENIQLMTKNGIIIYLKMSTETQIERIESLEEKSLKKRFLPTIRDSGKEFMEGRNILYENNDFTVETDNKSVEEICYEIDRFLDKEN